jgi:copper chaperone CopZ
MTFRSVVSTFFALLLLGATVPLHAGAQNGPDEKKSIESPDVTVYVDGIACPFCAYGLEKKLSKLDAIQKMEVQLQEGRVLIALKDGQSLTREQIQKAVKNAGFEARKIEFAGDESPGTNSS